LTGLSRSTPDYMNKKIKPTTIPKHCQLATVRETAVALRIDPETVRDFCAKGWLPYVRWGKQLRIRHSTIEEFLAQHTK